MKVYGTGCQAWAFPCRQPSNHLSRVACVPKRFSSLVTSHHHRDGAWNVGCSDLHISNCYWILQIQSNNSNIQNQKRINKMSTWLRTNFFRENQQNVGCTSEPPPHCRLQQRLQKLVGAEFDGHQEVLANRLQFDWQTSKNRLKTRKQTEILWKHTIIGLCEEFVKEPEGALHKLYSSCYASNIRPHPRDFWDFRSGSVREKCLWSAKVTSLSN